jgi:amidase
MSFSLGLAGGALGTETDGSIIGPASSNNVVGIKPSKLYEGVGCYWLIMK